MVLLVLLGWGCDDGSESGVAPPPEPIDLRADMSVSCEGPATFHCRMMVNELRAHEERCGFTGVLRSAPPCELATSFSGCEQLYGRCIFDIRNKECFGGVGALPDSCSNLFQYRYNCDRPTRSCFQLVEVISTRADECGLAEYWEAYRDLTDPEDGGLECLYASAVADCDRFNRECIPKVGLLGCDADTMLPAACEGQIIFGP